MHLPPKQHSITTKKMSIFRSFITCTPCEISLGLKSAGHITSIKEMSNTYRVLVSNLEGKRSLGKPKHGWEKNIKINLNQTSLVLH
jgi:hypothetical protein